MDLIKDPFEQIKKLQKEFTKEFERFDKKFDKFFKGSKVLDINKKEPEEKITSKGNNLVVSLEMPGMDKKDIYVRVAKDSIEVSAIRKQHIKVNKKKFFKEERSIKSFYKSIPLSTEVIPEKATAKYDGKTLKINLVKSGKKLKGSKKKKLKIK